MRSAILLILLLGASAAVGALASATEASPSKRDLIVEAAKKFSDEWAAGNIDGVLSVYADDAREFYSFFTLDGKENIRKYVEKNINKKNQVSLNVGNSIIELTNNIWLEEVGSQRVGGSSFPRLRLWKLDQSGQPKLWRHATNGIVAAAPKGLDYPTLKQDNLCFASDQVCQDTYKKSEARGKIAVALENIASATRELDTSMIVDSFAKDARMLMLKEQYAGSDSIRALWSRAAMGGARVTSMTPGTSLTFLGDSIVLEEGGRFESAIGNGRFWQLWKLVPKEKPANSIDTPTLDDDAHAGQPDFDVFAWRTVLLGPNPKKN